jgi:hypothetical protein
MKKFKKLLAAVCTGAMMLSSVTVFGGQDASALADGTAYLNINNSDWGDFDAEWTNAEITGDGSYTVGMVASEGQSLAQFNALEVVNGESYLGTGCVLTVDSIKINGEDVELTGSSYTCSADGAGVTTRVNIYNEWNAPDDTAVAGDDNHLDNRVAEGSVMDASACLFSSDYVDSSSASGFKVESIEVNFTVSGFGTSAATADSAETAVETEEAEGPAVAHLNIYNADWSDFDAEYVDAEITGDGTYTVSMNAAEGQSLAQFNALQVANGETLLGNACVLTVDSIKINGEDVELQGSSYTCSADGAGVDTRVNIYNEWNAPDDTAVAGDDNHLDNRVAEGSVMDATACLISSDYIDSSSASGFKVESIEVTFTVSNFGVSAGAGESADTAADVDLDGTYNAYLGIQGPKYSFRDAYGNASTGFGTDFFNQVTKQGDTATGESIPATINDVEIAGNGVYTVSITGLEWPDDEFSDQDYMNLIFVSTNIPNTGAITISDIALNVDGRDVSISPIVDPDSTDYLNMMIQNIWNEDASLQQIGYYSVPFSDITVTFTVSGFNYDNPDATGAVEEAAAEETVDTGAADTESADVDEAPAVEAAESTAEASNGTSPVVVVVIIVVIVAVVAGVAVYVKKKKAN